MKATISLLVALLIFVGFIMNDTKNEYHPSRGEQLVNSTLAKSARIIKDKYNLRPSGEGAAMPGGPIQEFTLCFDTKSPQAKEELRRLLIESANELLKQVTENEEIQQFLRERPFTIKNVQIIIYNHDKKGREVYDPGIATAEISEGVLTYRTVDSADTFKFKQQFQESYEEALKALSIH
jgi:hypothetical protein